MWPLYKQFTQARLGSKWAQIDFSYVWLLYQNMDYTHGYTSAIANIRNSGKLTTSQITHKKHVPDILSLLSNMKFSSVV